MRNIWSPGRRFSPPPRPIAHFANNDSEACRILHPQELLRERAMSLIPRSEEHTSELQSRENLVCRLLLDTATLQFYTLSLRDALPIFMLTYLRAIVTRQAANAKHLVARPAFFASPAPDCPFCEQ